MTPCDENLNCEFKMILCCYFLLLFYLHIFELNAKTNRLSLHFFKKSALKASNVRKVIKTFNNVNIKRLIVLHTKNIELCFVFILEVIIPGGGDVQQWMGKQPWGRHHQQIQLCTCRSHYQRQEQQYPRHTF